MTASNLQVSPFTDNFNSFRRAIWSSFKLDVAFPHQFVCVCVCPTFLITWRLFKGNLQLTIVTAYLLLHSWQHIFNLTSDSLLSLCEVRSEGFVQLFFSEEMSVRKMEALVQSWLAPVWQSQGQSSVSGIFCGRCSISSFGNPLCAPPKPTSRAKASSKTHPRCTSVSWLKNPVAAYPFYQHQLFH